jgi:hypothetical protein
VRSFDTPPTRTYEWVSRAPEISSSSVYSHSRALSRYRNGVNAPSSIAEAPMQVRWSVMRETSLTITRMYSARGGILPVSPSSFSTAIA